MYTLLKRSFNEVLNLVFPSVCVGCGRLLNHSEQSVCLLCEAKLAYLNYEVNADNAIDQLFWGKVHIEKAAAFFAFKSGGVSQLLLHELKYNHKHEVGSEFGLRFGQYLRRKGFFPDIDLIIPVPLHISRLSTRGYNQSEMIADGLAQSYAVPVDTHTLQRVVANKTQTHKNKEERRKNVEQIFVNKQPGQLAGKHVLLVDDVVTTGATLEACAQALLASPNLKISIACLAKA